VQGIDRLVKKSSSHPRSSPATKHQGNSKASPPVTGVQSLSRGFAASHALAYFGVAFCGNDALLGISLVVSKSNET
jgi:hypothetical protein